MNKTIAAACVGLILSAAAAPALALATLAVTISGQGWHYAATEARKGELFVQAFRDGAPQGAVQVVFAADLRLPDRARLLREPPRAAAVALLCLPRLRGASYDAAACFSLAPDYVQGFPARGG